MQELMRLRNQEEQKKSAQKKGSKQQNLIKNLNQKDSTKNRSGNKNLFLKDKKIIQPMTEPNKSFNKNK